MHRITVEVGSHGVVTTVSEMRKRMAKILSGMDGNQEVFFTFVAHLGAKPSSFELYDHQLDRHTGFGSFQTAAEAQIFLDSLAENFRYAYSVRPVLTR